MSSKKSELPKWACPNCGQIFRSISEAKLDEKADHHLESCNVEKQSTDPYLEKEDAKYSVSLTPPRDPDQYSMSKHFHSMLTRRKNPEPTTDIIKQVLQFGHIKSTHKSGRFIFEFEVEGWCWWVVVQMVDDAFTDLNKKHVAVTVYSPDSKEHEETVKYV